MREISSTLRGGEQKRLIAIKV